MRLPPELETHPDLDFRRTSEEAVTLDVAGRYLRPELFDFRPIRTGNRHVGTGELPAPAKLGLPPHRVTGVASMSLIELVT